MRTITVLIITFFICYYITGQTSKTIIVTKSPQNVPLGKKWVLEAGKTIRVQVNNEILISGSLCNALFLSIPRMISNVNRGNILNAESYILIFKDSEKVPYTNDYTYDLTVISIADKNISVFDLQHKSPEEVGVNKIIFKTGESVFVGNCLESLELKEINMTQTELLEINKKDNEINKTNQSKLFNFNIPIKPDKHVEPGTKPEIHDSKLTSIVFSSIGVVHKQPGKAYAFDDVSTWTLTLNVNKFILQSPNGINKTYTVIKIDYDEKIKMQRFTLGNSNNDITHNLLISWSNRSNEYTLLLSSTDKTEEYQFQKVQSIDKQYQNK